MRTLNCVPVSTEGQLPKQQPGESYVLESQTEAGTESSARPHGEARPDHTRVTLYPQEQLVF